MSIPSILFLSSGILSLDTITSNNITQISSDSYIHGTILQNYYPWNSNYLILHLGYNNKYRPISILCNNPNFQKQYVSVSANPINSSQVSGNISHVANFNWKIEDGDIAGNYSLKFDFDTTYGIDDLSSLSIVGYDGNNWAEIPSTVSGTTASGSIETTNAVTDFSNYYFTLASTNSNTNCW